MYLKTCCTDCKAFKRRRCGTNCSLKQLCTTVKNCFIDNVPKCKAHLKANLNAYLLLFVS